MNRAIKFRAWDFNTSEMYYSCQSHTVWAGGLCGRVVSDAGSIEIPLNNIMQFTGLLDKNGKEIYESDIVLIDGNKNTFVSWNDKFASFCIKNDSWAFMHWFGEAVDPDQVEIIGNIRQNLKLLQ